jgi:hypothetical protein
MVKGGEGKGVANHFFKVKGLLVPAIDCPGKIG